MLLKQEKIYWEAIFRDWRRPYEGTQTFKKAMGALEEEHEARMELSTCGSRQGYLFESF